MFTHQVEGVKLLNEKLDEHRCVLLADEQGLGKTMQVIKTVTSRGFDSIFIVCPAVLLINWKIEIMSWSDIHESDIQIYSTQVPYIDNTKRVHIISYTRLASLMKVTKKWVIKPQDYLICDEAHYIKNPATARAKAIREVLKVTRKTILISGTPVENRPIELFKILTVVKQLHILGKYSDYERFGYRFCAGKRTPFCFDVSGSSNLQELSNILYSTIMIRRTKDVLDLPAKRYVVSTLKRSCNTGLLYRRLSEIDPLEIIDKPQKFDVGTIATLRKQLGLSKINPAIEYIKNQLESIDKLVIFAHHNDVLDKLMDALVDYNPVKLSGSVTPTNKTKAIDLFQTDPSTRVFIGQIQAAGVGITLTAAHNVIFVESSYVPSVIEQAADRCHRIGQKNCVLVQFLVTEDDLESKVFNIMVKKQLSIQQLMVKQ